MQITIGPRRIADATGTHEPGDTINFPCDALVALANAATLDPETGLAYASFGQPAPAPAPEPEQLAAQAAPTPDEENG